MPLAELILDGSPSNFGSFYFKATDQSTSLVVLVASKDQMELVLEGAGDAPGLYILQADDSTVYVGQSKVLEGRLKSHRATNKIGYRRLMVMLRDQGLSRYLDYAEARLYQMLSELGFSLKQTSLSGSLEAKRARLASLDKQHVAMADGLVKQFLTYAVALGLTEPRAAEPHGHPTSGDAYAPGPQPSCEAQESKRTPTTSTTGKRGRHASTHDLAVELADGRVLRGKNMADTFVQAVTHVGLARIHAAGFVFNGVPLVTREATKKDIRARRVCADGFLVYTHSDTPAKEAALASLAAKFGVEWTVRRVPLAEGRV